VFGTQKWKADVPLSSKNEPYRPDKVNFSRPQIATRSNRANHASCSLSNMMEELSPELKEDQAPNNLGTMVTVGTMVNVGRLGHVIAIHVTACKKTEWHITRIPKTSAKACYAQ
jgi:hypothetical protein